MCPFINEADMLQGNLGYGHQTNYPDGREAATGERVLSDVWKDVSHLIVNFGTKVQFFSHLTDPKSNKRCQTV